MEIEKSIKGKFINDAMPRKKFLRKMSNFARNLNFI